MNPQLTSALVAAVVSLAGVVVGIWQLRLRKEEVEKIGAKLQAEAEALRQTLMKDVLARRMNAYAALWRVFITYERNWDIEERPLTTEWAEEFLRALNACNAEHGVFFSQQVYVPFYQYRQILVDIARRARKGEVITDEDIKALRKASTFGVDEYPSLATAMKDDLGSYMRVVIQA